MQAGIQIWNSIVFLKLVAYNQLGMSKLFTLIVLIFLFFGADAQVDAIPNDFKTPEVNDNLSGAGRLDENGNGMFNNIDHPLSITGVVLTVGGAVLYYAAALKIEGLNKSLTATDLPVNGFRPTTTLHHIGIGAFFTGAVLFAIFSTERDKGSKRKKVKKKYSAADWEVIK